MKFLKKGEESERELAEKLDIFFSRRELSVTGVKKQNIKTGVFNVVELMVWCW